VGRPVRALWIALAAALAALGVLAALLAADVRSWPPALTSGDDLFAASAPRVTWIPPTRLGGLAQDLLALQGDVQLRRALQLYRESGAVPERLDNAVNVQTTRAEAQDALTAAARSSPPQDASQALTLLGILAFHSVAAGGGSSQTDAALSDFTDAVRTDPENELAKYDLELLLRLTAAHGVRPGAGQSAGGVGRSGRHGAAGLPGSGF
jgi:hypothetical protein